MNEEVKRLEDFFRELIPELNLRLLLEDSDDPAVLFVENIVITDICFPPEKEDQEIF